MILKIRKKVWGNKYNGQKCVTIPKYCEIEIGEEVIIEKAKVSRITKQILDTKEDS